MHWVDESLRAPRGAARSVLRALRPADYTEADVDRSAWGMLFHPERSDASAVSRSEPLVGSEAFRRFLAQEPASPPPAARTL